MWLTVLHWFTFVWLFGWAVRAVLDIGSRNRRPVSFLLVVFFVFYGIPIVLDLTLGTIDFGGHPGFRAGATAESVAVVYDVFVAACPVFWWLTARSHRRAAGLETILPGKKVQHILWLLLCSPLIALVFAPQPDAYLSYGAVIGSAMSTAASDYHKVIAGLALVAVASGASLLLVRPNFGRTLFLTFPFVSIAMWLQGKRCMVALYFVLIWAVAWMRGFLTRSRVITFGALSLIGLASYTAWYQREFRPLVVADSYSVYENLRIDFGRDHDLKAAIFCELSDGGDVRILDYRGQSMLFYLTAYVPRYLWPDKPWPYAIYMTAYALQAPRVYLGWGLTTSFLDEAVANFGWTGLLIGPLIFTILLRVCEKSPDPLVRVTGVLVVCLLMTVEFVAFSTLAIAWFFYLGWSRHVLRSASGQHAL